MTNDDQKVSQNVPLYENSTLFVPGTNILAKNGWEEDRLALENVGQAFAQCMLFGKCRSLDYSARP